MLVAGLDQRGVPSGVLLRRLADVASEQPLVDQVGHGPLGGCLAVPVAQLLRHDEGVVQARRRDAEAEAQGRQHRLGEGPDVDHVAGVVEALQGFERSLGEAELTVVVVLHHDGSAASSPGQQRGAPTQRHRDAERELVGRRRVDHGRAARKSVDDQALVVDGHVDHLRAVRREELSRRRVARLFHRDHRTRAQHHPGDQVERLLRALRHEHVVGRCLHRPRDAEVARDGVSQTCVTAWVGVPTIAAGPRPQLGGHHTPPGLPREQRGIGHADAEVVPRAEPGARRGPDLHRRRDLATGVTARPRGHVAPDDGPRIAVRRPPRRRCRRRRARRRSPRRSGCRTPPRRCCARPRAALPGRGSPGVGRPGAAARRGSRRAAVGRSGRSGRRGRPG